MGEINQPKYERELDYLYGKYSGKSALDKKIQNVEEILNKNKKLQEDNLEEIFDKENMARLNSINPGDMTWQDVELYNDIRKKYENIGKDFSGNDFPKPVGFVPDMTKITSKIVNTCNQLIPLLQSRNVQVSPLPEGSSVQDILTFVLYIKDQLKYNTQPVNLDSIITETGYDEDEFKSYGDVFAKQDIKQSEFVIDYDIDGIASKGDTLIIKNYGSWERKPKYTKEELIQVKQEVDAILRSYT